MIYQPSAREILFVEPNDEIPAVVDKVRSARGSEIALVVPYGARIFRTPVDLLLLQREALAVQKIVTIISSDPNGRSYAQAAGMAVADRIEELAGEQIREPRAPEQSAPQAGAKLSDIKSTSPAPEPDTQPSVPPMVSEREEPPLYVPPLPVRPPKARVARPMVHLQDGEKLEAAVAGRSVSWVARTVMILAAAVVLVAGAVAYLMLPTATVEVRPKTEPFTFDVEITVDKEIQGVDSSRSAIPGQFEEVQKAVSREFNATAERDVEEKAQGEITIFNAYSSSPQTLVATTRLLSTDQKLFRTTKTVTIPGAKIEEGQIIPSSLAVSVVADAPGAEYNVGPADFTIPGFQGTPKYNAFTGKSKAAMSGGAKGRVKVVRAEDLDSARAAMEGDVLRQAESELKAQISPDLKLIDGAAAVAVLEAASSVAAGAVAERFTYTVKAVGRAAIFREDDLGALIDETLKQRLSDNRATRPQDRKVQYENVRPDYGRGTLTVLVRVAETLVSKIDVGELRRELAGRNQVQAQQYVDTRPAIDQIKVSLWPFWVRRIPNNPDKVVVKIL
ncbi:hypothetical protein HYW68_00280 [Candidatus Parcubacteria bacterium]|nr:hypothetical protein [Candidatus Parcubacteria bacterium]